MRNQEAIRRRYLRDPLPVRLGGLAADLARIASASENPANAKALASLLEESTYFIEWTTPEAPLETQTRLVELQVQLALCRQRLSEIYQSQSEREHLIQQSKQWSDEILNLSGLPR